MKEDTTAEKEEAIKQHLNSDKQTNLQ